MPTPNRRIGSEKKATPSRVTPRTSPRLRSTMKAPAVDSWRQMDHEHEKDGARICSRCFAVFYDGFWHRVERAGTKTHKPKRLVVELCDACRMQDEATSKSGFVGEVQIGAVSPEILENVLRTIRNVGNTAVRKDPEERILLIERKGKGIHVTTSENQLAVRIGKKLDSSFKGGSLEIKYSKEDKPIRVYWNPPQQ